MEMADWPDDVTPPKPNPGWLTTHDWDDLGGLRVRRWPSAYGGERHIKVTVYSWAGTSPGATHWQARVEEADNEWWSESRGAWIRITGDTTADGHQMTVHCDRVEDAAVMAAEFVRRVLARGRATRTAHRVIWDGPGAPEDLLAMTTADWCAS